MRGRYPKFEVCFARSVNGMKKDVNLIESQHPAMRNILKRKSIDRVIDINRAKEWERKLKVSAGMDGKSEAW